MVLFIRINAPAAWALILPANKDRICLIFKEERGLGYWINITAGGVNTCFLLEDQIKMEAALGWDVKMSFYGEDNLGLGGEIQMIIQYEIGKQPTPKSILDKIKDAWEGVTPWLGQ